MHFFLPNLDVSFLDHLLINKCLKVMPACFYEKINQEHLAIWCHKNGIYGLPTDELINWLKTQIVGKTIEIGAGNGAIGRSLNIPITDSYLMNNLGIAAIYALQGQPITSYPDDVIKLDAIEAIDKYNPETVIGCWVTHKYREDEHSRGGNMFGIEEDYILSKVKKYIVIGNDAVHSTKRILKYKHNEYKFPWLYSRSMNTTGNTIYMWQT